MHDITSKDIPAVHPRIIEIRKLAKRLHRNAVSDSPSVALPVLRRLINGNCIPHEGLAQLFKQRVQIQRKHCLQLLAVEAGFEHWERYRAAIPTLTSDNQKHFDLVSHASGYPNMWFSTLEQALSYAQEQGGQVIEVGQQAVVIPAHS